MTDISHPCSLFWGLASFLFENFRCNEYYSRLPDVASTDKMELRASLHMHSN